MVIISLKDMDRKIDDLTGWQKACMERDLAIRHGDATAKNFMKIAEAHGVTVRYTIERCNGLDFQRIYAFIDKVGG